MIDIQYAREQTKKKREELEHKHVQAQREEARKLVTRIDGAKALIDKCIRAAMAKGSNRAEVGFDHAQWWDSNELNRVPVYLAEILNTYADNGYEVSEMTLAPDDHDTVSLWYLQW